MAGNGDQNVEQVADEEWNQARGREIIMAGKIKCERSERR
jgi:hypothetical protein